MFDFDHSISYRCVCEAIPAICRSKRRKSWPLRLNDFHAADVVEWRSAQQEYRATFFFPSHTSISFKFSTSVHRWLDFFFRSFLSIRICRLARARISCRIFFSEHSSRGKKERKNTHDRARRTFIVFSPSNKLTSLRHILRHEHETVRNLIDFFCNATRFSFQGQVVVGVVSPKMNLNVMKIHQ